MAHTHTVEHVVKRPAVVESQETGQATGLVRHGGKIGISMAVVGAVIEGIGLATANATSTAQTQTPQFPVDMTIGGPAVAYGNYTFQAVQASSTTADINVYYNGQMVGQLLENQSHFGGTQHLALTGQAAGQTLTFIPTGYANNGELQGYGQVLATHVTSFFSSSAEVLIIVGGVLIGVGIGVALRARYQRRKQQRASSHEDEAKQVAHLARQ